jgi:hypothetical protein
MVHTSPLAVTREGTFWRVDLHDGSRVHLHEIGLDGNVDLTVRRGDAEITITLGYHDANMVAERLAELSRMAAFGPRPQPEKIAA